MAVITADGSPAIGLPFGRRGDQHDRPVYRVEPVGARGVGGVEVTWTDHLDTFIPVGMRISNGSAVATRISGARVTRSSHDASGFAPATAQTRFSAQALAPSTRGQRWGGAPSRAARPIRPRPWAKAGTERWHRPRLQDRRVGPEGHPGPYAPRQRPQARPSNWRRRSSPRAALNQSMRVCRPFRTTARSPNARKAVLTAARGLGAIQSAIATASIAGRSPNPRDPTRSQAPPRRPSVRNTIR